MDPVYAATLMYVEPSVQYSTSRTNPLKNREFKNIFLTKEHYTFCVNISFAAAAALLDTTCARRLCKTQKRTDTTQHIPCHPFHYMGEGKDVWQF
jgi:hypothetical protein